MIVVDTNIISTFARIQRIELLFVVAETDSVHLTPAVAKELKVGLQKGLDFLQAIMNDLLATQDFMLLSSRLMRKGWLIPCRIR